MSLHTLAGIELFYVVSTILVGTITVNTAIALIRNRLSNKHCVALDASWELKIEEEVREAIQQAAEIRLYRSLSSTRSSRGFLRHLTARASFVDCKLPESEMITAIECLMREIQLKFDEVSYLGKHTSKGRENDDCLYARCRLNGLTQCIGEVSSLRQSRYGTHVMVSLTSTDALLVQEKAWGLPSSKSSLGQLAAIFSAARTTEMVMPLPRNMEELRTVTQSVLEAAVYSVGGVEPCA